MSLPTSLKSAANKLGEEGKEAVEEAKKAHNSHLPHGMKELNIGFI
jgi:phosphoribosyl-ATP pyrophosphohydrolase